MVVFGLVRSGSSESSPRGVSAVYLPIIHRLTSLLKPQTSTIMAVKPGQRDFAQSVREPHAADVHYRNVIKNDINTSQDSTERLSFMSSVVVVPKSSGQGYDVYKSPVSAHRDNPVSDYLSIANEHTHAASPAFRVPGESDVGPSQEDGQLNPQISTHSKAIVFKGKKFSMNIGNPVMQKKTQNKIQAVNDRAEMFLSTRLESANKELLKTAKVSRSKPATPILIRKSNTPSSSDLQDLNGVSKRPQARPETPPRPASTSGSPRSSPNKAYVNTVPTSGSQLEPTGISAAFKHDEVCSFHESLINHPQRDPSGLKSTSPIFNVESGVSITRNEYLTRSASPAKSEPPRNSMRNIISKLRKKLTSKQLEARNLRKRDQASNNNSSHRSSESYSVHDFECSCQRYHCHKFSGNVVNHDLESRKEKRQELILNSMNLLGEQEAKNVQDPSHIFWIPSLSFHAYKHGDRKVKFASLWPKYKDLKELLQNTGIDHEVLSPDALLDICTLACSCGPVHLLQCLLELRLIRIDQVLEGGSGLLHVAILAHNVECAQFLMAAKISPKIRDIKGLTADQVCFNPSVRKQMAPRYLLNRDVSRDKIMLKPSLQDKDFIFKLAASPRHFVEIQKKLQTFDFNVNTECDNNGDFLLHIVVREGLNQLPLLMALVNIQKADVELCNADGMTPLMIAAQAGNSVLCDVLMCLFGADPNKRNPQSGKSALHFAAESNHRKTVECLIRRGADINMEDHDGLRADDVPACLTVTDDCREVIIFNRMKRLEMLSDLVKKGEVVSSQLLPSDLYVVDEDGNTLVMLAASYNRFQTLHCLLDISKSTMNAQHSKTGMTALALAAKLGHVEAVTVMLRHKSVPTIADMTGYLPLHHAVMNNHESVVDVILDFYPDTFVGLYKAMRFCKRTSLHTKLKSAWERRQEEIVTPKLLGCALNGNAEDLFLLLDEGDNINPKSGTGNWPLYLAVENGHLEVLKLLCEKGGDIQKRHPTTGATSLHVAAKMGHQSIVSFLLQYCSNSTKNLSTSTHQMNTSSVPTAMQQNPGRRKKSLDINAVDKDNKTALQLAAEKGFSRIVDLLLSHGATTALLDREGNLVTCPQYEGVRIMIENCRQQHTHQIIKAIEEKSKKAPPVLPAIWLPKFDHNLRNKEGSTPLMVAAETGKVQTIQFLLESAVYPEVMQFKSDSAASDSDTDSGVLVPVAGSKDVSKVEDEFLASVDRDLEQYAPNPDMTHESKQQFTSSFQENGSDLADSSEFHHKRLSRIINDANRPKGLSIFHDGMISHVCAMNLNDGTNVLHHSIRNADAPHILSLFLDVDATPLNMQDDRGETVLHLACRLKRKKSVELLLARPDLDLNIRTFDGSLPEEVTSSKVIKKILEKARASSAQIPVHNPQLLQHEGSICGSEKTSSIGTSTVNFDRVHSRYEKLKHVTKGV